MKIKLLFSLILLLCVCLNSNAQKKLLVISNNLESYSDSFPWTNLMTRVEGNAFSGNFFSTTDSVRQFGLGYKGAFPEMCMNKNLHIKISEYLRTNLIDKNFAMVITVSSDDSVIVWNSKNTSSRIKKINVWTPVSDEIDLPANITGKDYTLAIYLWNMNGQSVVDIDDLQIEFEEKTFFSFLPLGFIKKDISDGWEKISSTKNFRFYYNKEDGLIQIINTVNDTLISSLAVFSDWKERSAEESKQSWNYHFYYRKDSIAEEGKYIIFTAHDEISESRLRILANDEGRLSFNVTSVFIKPVLLNRQSLIIGFNLPLLQVYKKSTLTDAINFNSEYWLAREGFEISNGSTSLVLYHPEEVSSVQLDVKNKLAIFNLDFSADHPFLHSPLLKKSENKFEDYSSSVYKKDDLIKSSFTFYSVPKGFVVAKILGNPYGYTSSFTWTDHADYTDLRTQKAVYFGSEKVDQPKNVTGGFLKYSIPVTKSIFYSNPDKVDNSEKAGFLKGLEANYSETEGFVVFLKQLYESGIEICLHTPDHYTCDRKLLSEALDKTKSDFAPVTWIDHGYDNSPRSNREDLVCDGADSTSQWYSADLWKKYGIKYFWNSYFEDTNIFMAFGFNSFFSVPYSGWDDAFPTPLYWRNKTRTGDFIHWRTTSTLDLPDGSLWSYYFSEQRLKDLVDNRNDIIIHSYPARADSTNGYYVINDGVITANDEFNKALERLSKFRLMEKIRLTTVDQLLDYRTSIEHISYEILPDGIIRLQNKSKAIIRGLSLSAPCKEVKAGNKEILKKYSGNELLFWFDLNPGEVMNLELIK